MAVCCSDKSMLEWQEPMAMSTPLHMAVGAGRVETTKALLAMGANPSARCRVGWGRPKRALGEFCFWLTRSGSFADGGDLGHVGGALLRPASHHFAGWSIACVRGAGARTWDVGMHPFGDRPRPIPSR